MEIGYIYKITCLVTNKVYIGQTIHPPEERLKNHIRSAFRGSDHKFHRAIRKYGAENFRVEELSVHFAENKRSLRKILNKEEISAIKLYDSKERGYNSTLGGDGGLGYHFSEEIRKQISKRQKEFYKTHDSPFKGHHFSEETKQYFREKFTGRKHTEETKHKMSLARKGYRHSEETKEKIRQSRLGKKREPFSEEWKKNISKALLGKKKGPYKKKKKDEYTCALW